MRSLPAHKTHSWGAERSRAAAAEPGWGAACLSQHREPSPCETSPLPRTGPRAEREVTAAKAATLGSKAVLRVRATQLSDFCCPPISVSAEWEALRAACRLRTAISAVGAAVAVSATAPMA